MTKTEQIAAVLERMGYKPLFDEDGDILIRYQLKHFYFFYNEADEDQFIQIIHPQFAELEEGEETIHLAAMASNVYVQDISDSKEEMRATIKTKGKVAIN